MRKAFVEAFDKLGGAQGLYEWGKDNPDTFYPMMKAILPRDSNISLVGMTWEELLAATINRPNPPPAAQ
jgi:hypothetical protein